MQVAKHTTAAQVAQFKAAIATALVAGGRFSSIDEVHEHVAFSIEGHFAKRAWWQADCYLNQFVTAFSQNVSVPASPETRAWSDYEGGHVLWDSRKAETAARRIAADCGIEVR